MFCPSGMPSGHFGTAVLRSAPTTGKKHKKVSHTSMFLVEHAEKIKFPPFPDDHILTPLYLFP